MRLSLSKLSGTWLLLILASASSVSAQAEVGFVRFVCPSDATIRYAVDGNWKDTTAAAWIPVQAGRHRIVVRNPSAGDFSALDFDTTVEVGARETTWVEVRFPKLFLISSNPFGSEIRTDGRIIGTTPMYWPSDSLRLGRVLEFHRSGYLANAWSVSTMDLERGSSIMLLSPVDGRMSTEGINTYWKRTGHERHGRLLIVTAGLAVLSGAATAYLKNIADDRFERAKLARQAGDVALQKKLEKETRTYDKYAVASLITMEINVTILLGTLILAK